jgi:sulfite reductase (NADPH) flavoprotein alpha-component
MDQKQPPFSRKFPYVAELTRHEKLTLEGSEKETRHFVISLGDSGLTYTPGDSLGTFPRNPPKLVETLLEALRFDPEHMVARPNGSSGMLGDSLQFDYTLNRANRKMLMSLAERIPQGEQRNRLMEIVDNDDELSAYIHTRDYIDILNDFSEARFENPEAFVGQLSPVVPRLYSIASSLQAHAGEVHLCIAVVRYETHGRHKTGLASGFFADTAQIGVRDIPIYVQESRTFRLPQDSSRDIIMCGPGTGIAPFRAFLEQRRLDGAKGRNWLFFGEQHQTTDFLYGAEFEAMQRDGTLHRLHCAFSRDQPQKIYVQHRMIENAKELWAWLQDGAYFYVCGDAKRMAKDVHATLIAIAQQQGGMSAEAAAGYVNVALMKTEKRYLRDVY